MASLTIRNLTATSLELKLVEHYAGLGQTSGLARVTAKVGIFAHNNTSSSSGIAEGAQATATQEVSIRVERLCMCTTDIKAANVDARETVRLTFEVEGGERYRVDTPSRTSASTEFTPLTDHARFRFTAIYLPRESFLTIFSSANLATWMKELRDEIPLSALSIPGTHNSPTYHRALPSVRCQAVSVREQLDNGVRFLDIRVQPGEPEDPSKDTLNLVHGVFPISLSGQKSFRHLVEHVFAYLDQNPSETVIMSVKREGPGTHTDAQLSRRLRDHYAGDVNRWWTAPWIPTLGEARHKIVLIRRFALEEGLKNEWNGQGWCINAESWAYNTPSDTCPSGDVCVQDFCEVLETENIDKKIQYAEEEFKRSASCVCVIPGVTTTADPPPPAKIPFYINFLSASNFWKVGCWPEKIAAKLNPAIIDYLCRRHHLPSNDGTIVGDGSTGIVVCDWVGNDGDWDLIRCIVGMNVTLQQLTLTSLH